MPVKKATTTEDVTTEDVTTEEGYVRLVGPLGNKTTVPESIVEALLESGFKKTN